MAELKSSRQRDQFPSQRELRIYIGAAPGVGKTYHMLNDATLLTPARPSML